MRDPRARFTRTARGYARWRPGYPPALVDWLARAARLPARARVADVGCGTGISTRLFAGRGCAVTGVDPNLAMLRQARRLGGARYRRGEAIRTGLASASVDLVACAQALHWFDLEAALREFARLLKPGGRCAAFWNLRAPSPLMRDYEGLLRRFSAEYPALGGPSRTIAALARSPRVAGLRRACFRHAQFLDREGFFGRVYSSSYVAHGVARRAEFDRRLDALFRRHARGGRVRFGYVCRAYLWRPAAPKTRRRIRAGSGARPTRTEFRKALQSGARRGRSAVLE